MTRIGPLHRLHTVFIHGTSLETALALLDQGELKRPSRSKDDTGYLGVYAPRTQWSQEHIEDKKGGHLPTWHEARDGAARYARIHAVTDYLATILGRQEEWLDDTYEALAFYLRRPIENTRALEREPEIRRLLTALRAQDYTRNDTLDVLREAQKRRGVLLGFNTHAREFEVEGATVPEEVLIAPIHAGRSIRRVPPISSAYIGAVEPLGDIERAALKKYRT